MHDGHEKADIASFSGGTSYDVSPTSRTLFLFTEWINFLAVRNAIVLIAALYSINPAFAFYGFTFLVAPILGLSKLIHSENQHRAHRARSKHAKLIFDDLNLGGDPRYCLYLRPFLTSDRLRIPNSRFRRRFFPSLDRFFGLRIDLETVLAIALERANHPLIAIGETGFSSGAPKLVATDANWHEIFRKLAGAATSIIIVPLPRPSTLWEIDQILREPSLLKKTMFVMPMRLRSGVQEQLEPFWATIQKMMRERGLNFPALDPAGGLFFLDDGGRVLHQVDSGGFDIDYIESVLRGLVNQANLSKICDRYASEDRSALFDVLDRFLYLSPRDSRLRSRPVPHHELLSSIPTARLLSPFIEAGLIVTYRFQRGSQLWREALLHPLVLNSEILRDWADRNQCRLSAKGSIIEASQHAQQDRERGLNDLSEACMAFPERRPQTQLAGPA
jgi:hypothetical protein